MVQEQSAGMGQGALRRAMGAHGRFAKDWLGPLTRMTAQCSGTRSWELRGFRLIIGHGTARGKQG